MLITPEHRQLNAQLHQQRPEYGTLPAGRAYQVSRAADDLKCLTILDYGCGKGMLKGALVFRDVREYDPAIPGKDAPPEPADLVYCGDVMEHVEPEMIGEVLDHIKSLALRGVLFVIPSGPAKKVLLDGRNAHLTQQQPEWWLPLLLARWRLKWASGTDTGLSFMGKA